MGQELAGYLVLVVEDDYPLAMDLAGVLIRAGAEIIGPAGNVSDALNLLDRLPDIASLDVQLGDETSFPIADEMARRGIPFVFATGAAQIIPNAHQRRPICSKPVADAAILKALTGALSPGPLGMA